MNTSATKVLQFLTGETEIEKVSVEQVKYLADEYPFFPIAQFIWAKKLKDDKSSAYLSQLQKSALYFTNPHWLNYQLNSISKPTSIPFVSEPTIESVALNETLIETKQNTTRVNEEDEADEVVIVDDFEVLENIETTFDENLITENVKVDNEEHSIQSTQEADTLINENVGIEELPVSESKVEEITDSPIEENIVSNVVDDVVKQQEEITEVELKNTTPITSSPEIVHENVVEEVIPSQDEIEISDHVEEEIDFKKDTEEELIEIVEHEEAIVAMDEHEQMFQNIKALLDSTTEEANADTGNAIVPIDPYHTIDYFASQGIHVELDKNPQDKLGKNLKKFTHWLRHMKKLGPEDSIPASAGSETETEIQKIADSSNTIKEIVTEAMAQVLEKQGKKEKAIELYNKLSFLYPHKIPYFADQIKKLKGD